MLKKLRQKIERKRGSSNFFWKNLILIKDLVFIYVWKNLILIKDLVFIYTNTNKDGINIINKNREDFLKLFPKNSIGAEVGVFKGVFTRHILEIVKPLELHLIDCWWKKHGEYYPDFGKMLKGRDLEISKHTDFGRLKTRDAYKETRRIVEKYDKNNASVFYVSDSLIALKKIKNQHLDWVYLDSSHQYKETKKELEIIKDKIKEDGIIAGHDWILDPTHYSNGVYKAVKRFIKKYNYKIFYIDNYTQWMIKRY